MSLLAGLHTPNALPEEGSLADARHPPHKTEGVPPFHEAFAVARMHPRYRFRHGSAAFAQGAVFAAPISATASAPVRPCQNRHHYVPGCGCPDQRRQARLSKKSRRSTSRKTDRTKAARRRDRHDEEGNCRRRARRLNDSDRALKLKAIDDKEKSLQRDGEDAQNDFQQDIQQTYSQLAQKVDRQHCRAYASQNGYTLDARRFAADRARCSTQPRAAISPRRSSPHTT